MTALFMNLLPQTCSLWGISIQECKTAMAGIHMVFALCQANMAGPTKGDAVILLISL
jgi:hypothetical protein